MTTIASAATLLARTLEQAGYDASDIYARAGLEAAPAQPFDARYPISRMQVVWAVAVEATGDACLGLRVAEQMQPQVLHGLGFAWLTSDTLSDALQRLVRYQRVISTSADFRLRTVDAVVELSLKLRTRDVEVHPAAIDAALAIAVRMCRLALQSALQPVRVSFKHRKPDCARRFEVYFGCPVVFAAPVNAVHFDAGILQQALPSANPELARVNDRVVIDYLNRFDRKSLSMRVRARLIDQLPGGQPSQAQVADALHMSVRNLQRRLQQEGSSFKRLLDETRRELAVQYVQQTHRPIGEITYLLGFSEPSNFTRAFRRWTGRSPHAFREQGTP